MIIKVDDSFQIIIQKNVVEERHVGDNEHTQHQEYERGGKRNRNRSGQFGKGGVILQENAVRLESLTLEEATNFSSTCLDLFMSNSYLSTKQL